jgi:hypothetical protein
VFRVPRRTTAPPVAAPPDQPTWHGTLTRTEPAPSRAPRAASSIVPSDRLRVAPWESIPAPWGEPENPVGYVVITTQPWPQEWWRPNAKRVPRDGDAAAELKDSRGSRLAAASRLPESRLDTGPGLNGTGAEGNPGKRTAARPDAAEHSASRIGVIPVVRGGATPASRDDQATATRLHEDRARRREARMQSIAGVRAQHNLERERLALARSHRKGSLTRFAIFAVGLVISLVAVEAASRRRS